MGTNKLFPIVFGMLICSVLLPGCRNRAKNTRAQISIEPLESYVEVRANKIIHPDSGVLVYDAGDDEIRLDTIINGCHIYYEDFYDQEFSGRYVIYNPGDSLLLCAAHCWGCDLNEGDMEKLNSRTKKRLQVQNLDLENRKITVTVLDGDVTALDLKGERYGNYWVEYDVTQNNTVAYTRVLSPGDTMVTMNNDVCYRVYYKGKFLTERVINSFSFAGVPDPEIYILAPTDRVWFEVVDNTLVCFTPMVMDESDCGFETWTKIDSTGNISLTYGDIILDDE